MNARDYNKLYVSKNREEGSEKIFLGYQTNTTEYRLLNDTDTYFHIPPYTDPIHLTDTTLINDGATGGPFPAASDHIFKSLKNYGNVSNNGTPTELPDGTWLCSWLYKAPDGTMKWLDRYFNSKKLNINLDEPDFYNGINYLLKPPPVFHNPVVHPLEDLIFFDVPSTLVFEPTVLYRYFHAGEKQAQILETTFGGVSGEYVLLGITDWKSNTVQVGLTSLPLTIVSPASSSELFPVVVDSQATLSAALGFEHTKNVDAYVSYDPKMIPTDDFTLAFWCKSYDWTQCPTTQLVGNVSEQGGFGVFVDTLSSYPYFVIPETSYGHILFVNQDTKGFLDKVISTRISGINNINVPRLVALDSNDSVYVCTASLTGNLFKLDIAGNVLAKSTSVFAIEETPISLLCDRDDNIILVTTVGTYTFDSQLNLKEYATEQRFETNTVCTFKYNISDDSSTLVIKQNVIDVKYIESTEWSIENDGHLYKNGSLFNFIVDGGTNLQVDPYNRLWVLHGNNKVSIYDSTVAPYQDPIKSFTVGTDFARTNKNVSFIRKYNRSTLSFEWLSIIYHSDEQYLYTNRLDGSVKDIQDLTGFYNASIARLLQQNSDYFTYSAKGDFTGYDRKRVFNSLTPYNNTNHLVVKLSLKDNLMNDGTYRTFKIVTPLTDWDNNTWKHIILTNKNRVATLYINGVEQIKFQYTGRYSLLFDDQPPMYIGSPLGVKKGLNTEIQTVASLFNGIIGEVKLYNYAIDENDFEIFLRANIIAEDIYWSLPIPTVQYIEKIERMFKHKLPGSKSNFYNIKLSGIRIQDPVVRLMLEDEIKQIVKEIAPAAMDLVNIEWIG